MANINTDIALAADGRVFRISGEALLEADSRELSDRLRSLCRQRCNDLFHHSYQELLFRKSDSNQIAARRSADFSSFYPANHLDFCGQIDNLLREGFAYPCKLFLNPTNICSYRCQVCSFNPTRADKGLYNMPWAVINDALCFFKKHSPHLAVNISGGGEPTLAPAFKDLLRLLLELEIKGFLTSNGSSADQQLWDLAVRACNMIVISIRGISTAGYQLIDCPPAGRPLFEEVVARAAKLVEERTRLQRENDLIIGVNSIVHPANVGHFAEFAHCMDRIGVDFLYFTPIAPNLAKWGLSVTEQEYKKTEEEFRQIAAETFVSNIKIRLPRCPYKISPEESFYYQTGDNGKERRCEQCFVCLFSPALIPSELDADSAKLCPCRSSLVQDNQELAYALDLGARSFTDVWQKSNFERVQQGIDLFCSYCHLERQYRDLAFMVNQKRVAVDGEFLLGFNSRKPVSAEVVLC